MLILSRGVGERIFVGHDIVVTIVEVRGGKVRVGVDAPNELDVHREELYREIYGITDVPPVGESEVDL